jgi:hypothetical protein
MLLEGIEVDTGQIIDPLFHAWIDGHGSLPLKVLCKYTAHQYTEHSVAPPQHRTNACGSGRGASSDFT